jgi:hypothetical protein
MNTDVSARPRSVTVVDRSWRLFGAYVLALGRWTASGVSFANLLVPLVTVPLAALLADETVTIWLAVGGGIVLAGVYVGALMKRPQRWSASSLPECLPIDGCQEEVSEGAPAAAR